MTQPEALRLAERLERYDATRSGYAKHCSLAAAELRRLHEVHEELLVCPLNLFAILCNDVKAIKINWFIRKSSSTILFSHHI